MLPGSYLIQSEKISDRGVPIAAGDFGDTYEAEFDGKKVCIKTLRSYVQDTGGVINKVRSLFFHPQKTVIEIKPPGLVDILWRSCCVEEDATSEYRPFPRCSHEDATTFRNSLRVDGK